MDSSIECPVCVGSVCRTRQFTCPGCNYKCCKTCIKSYILNSLEPSCVNPDCRRVFPVEILLEQLPSGFRAQYRDHLANLQLEQERQFLPEFAEVAERNIKLKRINSKIEKCRALLDSLNLERNQILLHSNDSKTRRQFNKKCASETCNGFLSSAYKCQICEKTTCMDCNVLRETDHQCRQEDIDTVRLLKSDTKNCPKCAVPIYRSSGCPQMFCVQCHTAFDWNTLRIIDGPIHNPHYFEIQQALAQDGARVERRVDMPCDEGTQARLIRIFARDNNYRRGNVDKNYAIQRSLLHMMEYSLREFTPELRLQNNRELYRVQFLMSDAVFNEETGEKCQTFTVEDWLRKLKLQQAEIMRTKGNHDILNTYLHTMGDIMLKLHDNLILPETTYSEMEVLRKIVNKALAKNCYSLGLVRRKISVRDTIHPYGNYLDLITVTKSASKK